MNSNIIEVGCDKNGTINHNPSYNLFLLFHYLMRWLNFMMMYRRNCEKIYSIKEMYDKIMKTFINENGFLTYKISEMLKYKIGIDKRIRS